MSYSQKMFDSAAYGGTGWQGRTRTHAEEIGDLWAPCGINNEWNTLRSVVLHRPGAELDASQDDPDAVQMLDKVDMALAAEQHDIMAEAYRNNGVEVHYVDPTETPSPNQMFCADLIFMTPEGAIMARPASTVRAGEERWAQRRVADLGMPIARVLRGNATFEGADAMWFDSETVVIGKGLRTNQEGADQVSEAVEDMGAEAIQVDMPYGSMHFMGMMRIADKDLAICWPRMTPHAAVWALRERGIDVLWLPEGDYPELARPHNFVTLGPRKILMAAGYNKVQDEFEKAGIECVALDVSELVKAAGGIGCLTGVLHRDPI